MRIKTQERKRNFFIRDDDLVIYKENKKTDPGRSRRKGRKGRGCLTFQWWFIGQRGKGVCERSMDVAVDVFEVKTIHGLRLGIDRMRVGEVKREVMI